MSSKKKPVSNALLERLSKNLYVPVVCDILDGLGVRDHTLRHDIRPLFPEARFVGRAATALAMDVYEEPEKPYDLLMSAIDNLAPGACLISTTNGSMRGGLWGELLSTAVRARGATGVVIDGATRDTLAIIEMKFPVFARGIMSADSKGRVEVVDIDCPIDCGGVLVRPGDAVFGDHDGVVVIPQALTAEVVRRAEEKVFGENTVRKALAGGMSVRAAFRKYGIL